MAELVAVENPASVSAATGQSKKKMPRVQARVVHVNGTARQIALPADEDIAAWEERLKDVLATSSEHFVKASIRQLIEANKLPGQAVACTTSLSAGLAFIGSLEPENEAQAALAMQLAALHSASMNVLGRIHNVGERNVVAMASAGAKLERAFQSGLETYYRLKRGVHQVVRIERVEVRDGGQAVIGVVTGYDRKSPMLRKDLDSAE